jgi:hypothetical protein
VPLSSRVGNTKILPLLLLINHQQYFRITRQELLFQHMDRERPKTPEISDFLIWRQHLITNNDHPMAQMRMSNLIELPVITTGEVDAVNLGEETVLHLRPHIEGHIASLY